MASTNSQKPAKPESERPSTASRWAERYRGVLTKMQSWTRLASWRRKEERCRVRIGESRRGGWTSARVPTLSGITPLTLQTLELRVMLAVDVSLDGSDVTFAGDDTSSDHVYIRTLDDQLQWSTDRTTFSVDFNSSQGGDQTLVIQGSTSQSLNVTGSDVTLHLLDVATEGASLGASAPIIQVDAGATVSTVLDDSNAGSITLENATGITLDSGSALDSGGDSITISAVDEPFQSFAKLTASASVSLNDATITGGDVQITSEASAAALFGVDSLLGAFTLNTQNFFEGLSLGGGYVQSVANADISISGGSIVADSLTLDAEATANAELTVITSIVGAAFGETYPTATVSIDDDASIQTTSDIDVSTTASLEAEVRATQFAFGLTSTNKEKYNIAIAAASGELLSTIAVGDANIQSGGAASFTSQGQKKLDVSATAAAGREGVAGLGIGISELDSTVSALVDGSVTAAGDVTILADLTSTQNDTDAGAAVGEGSTLSKVKRGVVTGTGFLAFLHNLPIGGFQKIRNKLGSSQADTTAGKTGVSAAFSLVSQTNDVTAGIGENASVVSQNDDIEVRASSSDEIQTSSHSSVTSSHSAKNTRAKAWSASLLIGSLTNNAEAYIGRNADVDAAGDLLVQSETRVPWEQQWAKLNGYDTITDKFNTNVGIQAGFFTTWTQASSKSEKLSVGGSVSVFSIDGHSDAYIEEGATVQAGAQTSIIALNENDTVNFGGQFGNGLPLPEGYGLAGAASRGSGVGGSVAAMTYENHVNARIESDAIVNTGGLLVMSRADERNISIVTQGGAADGTFAINGAGNLLFVDNFTLAQIDDGAQVTVGTLNVAVPRDFDTVDLANNGLFADAPLFDPLEQIGGTFDEPEYRVNVDTKEITLPYDHGFQSGDIVWYSNGGGVDIGGLHNNSAYTVHEITDNTLQLLDGKQVVPLNLDKTDGFGHSLLAGFDASSDVAGNTISGLPSHWEANLPVRYFKADGADTLTGLNPEQVYYLSVVDDGAQLLDAPDGSLVPIDPIGISGAQFLVPVTVDRDGASTEIVGLELKTRNPLRALDSNHDDVVSTDDEHIVSVTDDVYLTDTSLVVLSDDHAGLYSGTGGFTKGRSIGAGVSIAVSEIHRQTNAIIGNLERDLGSTLGVGVDSADEIYLGYNHGLSEGDLVTYAAGGDFPIAGLRDGESYFVNIVSDSDHSGDPTITLARSILEAQETVLTHFALADVSPDVGADSIDLGYTHGFQLGDWVMYSAGSGTPIGGLDEDTVYYVIPLSDTELALAASQISATNAFSTLFDPRDTVNGDSLTFDHEHGFVDGQRLLYSAGGGTEIGGLEDGEVVVTVYVDEYTIQLETIDGSSIELDASSSVGEFHAFQPGFLGISDNVDGNVIDVGYTHHLDIGDQVLYTASTPASAIGGLTSGEVYYVVSTGETTLLLATSEELAEKAQWRFFDSTTAISNVTDNTGRVSSVIDLALPHPYELNNALTYSTQAYYEDPDSQTISALQYIDPSDGSTKTLVDGQTVYAIPADSDTALDTESGTDVTIYYGLQIALSQNGPALQLVTTSATGFHGFHFEAAGIGLTPTTDNSTTHFLQRYDRVDLDTSSGMGTDHTIRLALDPAGTTQATHGLGGTFDPATAVASQSDDDAVTEIDLGFNHGFETGDAVIYSNGRGTSIGGLAHGVIYYVVKVDGTTIQLAESAEDAGRGENLVALDASVASGVLHGFGKVFDATPAVDSHLNTIQFGQAHGFESGDEVVYETNGGTAIGGLEDGKTYVVQVYDGDDTRIQLLDTDSGDVIDLDGTLATGDQHTLGEPISNTGFVVSSGEGLVTSNNNGEIVSISLAGSETAKRKAGNFSHTESSESEENPKYGISIAASFAINVVNDTTQAYVRDASLAAAGLDLRAVNVTEIDTGSGAIALATSTDQAKGLAGAFSINVIANTTTSLVDNASVTITGGDLEVDAENSSEIVAVAMGLTGVSGAFSLAGSVVVNVITSEAQALIENDSAVLVTADPLNVATGNVAASASDTNSILAIAGAISAAVNPGFTSGIFEKTDQIGVGVALALNIIETPRGTDDSPRGTVALISDSDLEADGVIDVIAHSSNTITSVAAAIAVAVGFSKSAAIPLSFSVNAVSKPTTASIRRKGTAATGVSGNRGVNVLADDDSDIVSVAGDVGLSSGSANGFALSLNVTNDLVEASLQDTTVDSISGDVQVTAHATPTITSIAAGGTLSATAGRQGSFSINTLTNSTQAFVTGTETAVTAYGSVLVSANDDAHIFSLAGSVVISGLSGMASTQPLSSIGIANSTYVSVNSVEAYIDEDVTVQAGGNLDALDGWSDVGVIVSADSTDTITTIAAGGVVDNSKEGLAIAGSATVSVLDETTHASIGDKALINQADGASESTNQSVVVRSNETTTLVGIAGAASLALNGGGVGAGADVAVVTKDVQAWLGEGSTVSAEDNVLVESSSDETATSVTGIIAVGASSTAIAGSVGVSVYDITTKALVESSNDNVTTVGAGGNVLVSAAEGTKLTLVDADLAVAETVGVGGSFGVPVLIKTTEAKIEDAAVVDALANGDAITVNTGNFATFGGDTSPSSLKDSVDLGNSDLPTDTDKGYLQNRNATPEQQTGFKGVAVTAVNTDQVELYTLGAVAGGQSAVQVSVGVNVVDVDTRAVIGNGAQINQTANANAGASNEQSVHIAAGSDFFTRSIIGGVAGSGGEAAATPGVGVSYITMDTHAYVADSAKIHAEQNITVHAHSAEDLEVVAIAIAGTGGEVAAAGAFAVIDLNNTAYAYLGDGVRADAGGNVWVTAEDLTDTDIIAGAAGLAIEGGGIGVSVGLSLIDKDTQAYIGEGAQVDALGLDQVAGTDNALEILSGNIDDGGNPEVIDGRGVGVSAYSVEDVFGIGAAGAGGLAAGAAGAITWQQIDSDTISYIDRNAQINSDSDNATDAHTDQAVTVTAYNRVIALGVDGSINGGVFGGFGGAVDIGTIANTTHSAILADVDGDSTASTDTGLANARGDVRAAATSDRDIRSRAAAAGGGGVTLDLGVSFWTIGDHVSATYTVDGQTQDPLSGLDDSTEQVGNDTTDVDAGYESSGSNDRGDNSDQVALHIGKATDNLDSFTDLLSFGDGLVSETKAYIGENATVNAGGDLSVVAHEQTDVSQLGGALAVGGGLGAGGGAAILNLASETQAFIGDGAVVSDADDVTVRATADETTSVNGVAGALSGGAAVTAQYAESDVTSVQSSSIGQGAQVQSANALVVEADHSRDLHAFTAGGGLGSLGAAGFSGALTVAGGTVEAVVAEDAVLGDTDDDGNITSRLGSVQIDATSTTTRARAEAYAVEAGAGLAVQATEIQATVDPVVQAGTLSGVEIYTTGAVGVDATVAVKAEAEGFGVEVAAGVAGGGMGVLADVSPTITAAFGELNTIDAQGDISVNAAQTKVDGAPTANATGFGVAASIVLTVTGTKVESSSETSSTASIGDGSQVTADDQAVHVRSAVHNDLEATADGGSGAGIASVGSNIAVTDASTTSAASIGSGVSVTADSLDILSNSADSLDAEASNNKFAFGFASPDGKASGGGQSFSTDAEARTSSQTLAVIQDFEDDITTLADSPQIIVKTLTIKARRNSELGGKADDIALSLIDGVGGARYLGAIDSRVDASIGNNVVVTAPTISILAAGTSEADETIEASSATGGLAGSSAVTNTFDVVHDTTADIGDGAQINADVVLASGPADENSSITILATNDSRFNNAAAIGSGGVFGSSINAAAELTYSQYDASVALGEGAVLHSAGEITLATRSSADSSTDTSAISLSLGTGGSADATTTADSANTVTIGAGATIGSQDDINLLAGQTSVLENVGDLVPDINEFIFEANVDGYVTSSLSAAGTLGSATATVNQTNHVTLGEDALLQAVSDAYLLTDAGLAAPTGMASLRFPGGASPVDPLLSSTSNNQIKVDGDIEVGLFNRQVFTLDHDGDGNLIVLDEDGNALSAEDQAAVATADSNVDLSDALSQRINTLLEETAWFSGSSLADVYNEQRTFWTELVTSLGGTLSFDTMPVQVSDVMLPAATLSDLFATSGNIVFEADNLIGTADLTAPTDTTIQVLNETPLTLLLADLLIPDRPGGQVRVNGLQVTSNDEVSEVNDNQSLNALVNISFNYSYLDGSTADADTEPSIVVTNTAQPGADVPSNLFFNGDVSNRSGDVAIDAADGSVLVNGELTAGSLSIASGGDFILSDDDSDGDGFFHAGADPFDLYADVAEQNEAQDSEVNSGPDTPIDGTTGSTQPDAGATIVAGSVLISAENLNINGIIQSGIPYHSVTVADPDGTLPNAIDAADAAYQSALAAGTATDEDRYTTLDDKYLTVDTGTDAANLFQRQHDFLALQWDAQQSRLVLVGDIEVKGGFMQLIGNRVLNSSGGELRVVDGYGTIDIDNETAHTIVLSGLNTGRGSDDAEGIDGTILISEKARADEAVDGAGALNTTYTRTSDGITITTNKKQSDGSATDPTILAGVASTTYSPLAGTRYQWVSSGSEGSVKLYEVNGLATQRTSVDQITIDDYLISDVPDGRSELESNGTYTEVDASNTDVYDYTFTSVDFDEIFWEETIVQTIEVITGTIIRTRYNYKVTDTVSTSTTHTHSVRADDDIAIEFLGGGGSITVDSLGSVVIAGALEARGGLLAINAGVDTSGSVVNNEAKIESNDSDGVGVANFINLNAPAGIGTGGPVYIQQTYADDSSQIFADSSLGDINLSAASGDITIGENIAASADGSTVTIEAAAGNIRAASQSDNAHIIAGSVALTAAGRIGEADQYLNLDTGSTAAGALTATAGLDVYLRETTGDLYLTAIEASDVFVDVLEGSLQDATDFELADRDPDAVSALLSLWDNLGLIGDGADARRAQILSDTVATRNAEYARYWQLRNTMDDPSDPASYTFNFSDDQRGAMLAAGFTSDQIDALEQSAVDAFLALNDIFGPGGMYITDNDTSYDPDTFDAAFDYELTTAESDALTGDLTFTADGLLWSLSTGVTDRTTTVVFEESANVTADTLTVRASDAVGNLASEVKEISVTDGNIADIEDDAQNTTKIELLSAQPQDIAFFVEDSAGNKTAWADIDDGDGIVEPNEYNLIELTLTEDINVASNDSVNSIIVSAEAPGGVLVTGEDSLRVDQIDAGTAEVRLKAHGELFSGAAVVPAFYDSRVADWPLNDNKGASTIEDITGAGHDGAVGTGTTLANTGATLRTGQAASFDGTGTGITAPYAAELNPDSFTFGAWAKVTGGQNGFRSVVTSRSETGARYGYILYAAANNTWQFWTGNGTLDGWNSLQGPAVQMDEWVHLAVSFDADTSTKTLYVNGTLYIQTTLQDYAPNPDNGTHLGTGGNGGGEFNFHGLIDDAVLYSAALDEDSVRLLMNKAAVTNITAGNLVIESNSEGIGTRSTPLTLDLTGGLSTSSGADANLASITPVNQPLLLDTAFVDGALRLSTLGAIVDNNDSQDASGNPVVVTNIIADEVFLEADTVGTQANPIEMGLPVGSDSSNPPSLGGSVDTRMDVFAQGPVLVTNLGGQGASYAVTAEDDILLGLIDDEDGSVVFESINGSILNSHPNALNLLVATADLTVNLASEQIGDPDNPIEILIGTQVNISAPVFDASGISISGRPLGVFVPAADPGLIGGSAYVRTAEFNGDTYPDVLASGGGIDIPGVVLINNQDNTFTLRGTIGPSETSDTHVGDINNDGFDDVVSFDIDNAGVGRFTIWVNRADGTAGFNQAQTFSVAGDFSSHDFDSMVDLGDLTGDGFLDIVFLNEVERTINIYQNNRNNTFALGTVQDRPSWAGSRPNFQLAELTGDTLLDLIIGPTNNVASRVGVITNLGNGLFDTTRAAFVTQRDINVSTDNFIQIDLGGAEFVAVGDVDGNGLNDIFIGKTEITSSVDEFGNEIPGTSRGNELWLNQGVQTITTGEVASTDAGGTLITEQVIGTERLMFYKPLVEVADGVYARGWDVGTFGEQGLLVDLDLDNDLDLLLDRGNPSLLQDLPNEVWIFDNGAFHQTGQELTDTTKFGGVAFGDFDDDADVDAIFGSSLWLQSRIPLLATDQSFFFYENREAGDAIYTPTVLPLGVNGVTYGLDGVTNGGQDVSDWFSIDAESGAIRVVDPTFLDYESLSNHAFRFIVTITYFTGESDTAVLTGEIADLDAPGNLGDNDAAFADKLSGFSLDEDAALGSSIDVSSLASDVEATQSWLDLVGVSGPGDRITRYEIVDGTDGYTLFTITDDGLLTLAGEGLDYEGLPDGQKYIEFEIQAYDTEGRSQGPGTVRVMIHNAYEGPGLTEPTPQAFGAPFEFDARLDADGDNRWENINSDPTIDWVLGGNVERVLLSGQDPASIVAAYDFPGGSTDSDDYAEAISFDSISGDPTTNDMSVVIWFKPDDLTNNQVLWETGGVAIGSSLVLMQDETLGEFVIRFTVRDATETLVTQSVLPDSASDRFIQVIAALDLQDGNDTMQLYLNGELVDSDSDADISDWAGANPAGLGGRYSNTGGGLQIGAVGDLDFPSFDGQIALFRFYANSYLPSRTTIFGGRTDYPALPVNYMAIREGVAVLGDEGSTITLTRPFDSAGTVPVTMTASIGEVVDNGDGTWTWTYVAQDGPGDNQLVTITATEDSGLSESTQFQLYVDNVAPTISLGTPDIDPIPTILAGPQMSPFDVANVGSFGDVGSDTVTATANIGNAILFPDSNAWVWRADAVTEDLDGQVVTVTVTDSDGASSSVNFSIVYDGDSPAVTQATDSVTVEEGSTATNSGTYADPNFSNLFASIGRVVDNGDGTWNWTYDGAVDGDLDLGQVLVSVLDHASNETTVSFDVVVENVAPTVDLLVDNTTVDEGSPVTLKIDKLVDPGIDFVSQIVIDWGDGHRDTINVPASPLTSEQESNDDGIAGLSLDDLTAANNLSDSFELRRYKLSQAANDPGPVWTAFGGWDGAYLALSQTGAGSTNNGYTSDQIIPAWTQSATFSFQFRTDKDGANGWGWALLNTNNYGSHGIPSTFTEEPNYAGSLGVGFDTFNNDGEGANSVSLHYDGGLILSVPVTSVTGGSIPFETGDVWEATITIDSPTDTDLMGTATKVSVTVTNLDTLETITPIDAVDAPGLNAYDGRVQIGAKTGGQNQNHDIDNVAATIDSGETVVIDDFEPGNHFTAEIDGQIDVSADEDFFAIAVAAGDELSVTAAADTLSVAPRVRLFDDSLNLLAEGTGSLSYSEFDAIGDVYLAVDEPGGLTGGYTLAMGHQRTASLPFATQLVEHIYADGPQNHTISVTLIDEDGEHTMGSTIGMVVLNARPLITAFDLPSNVFAGDSASLSATAVNPAGDVDNPLSFQWSLLGPDGSTSQLSGSANEVLFSTGGTYTVELTVTDKDGGVATQKGSFEIEGAPTANAGGPYDLDEGKVVAIDAAFVTDPNQDASSLTYLWDLDGDGIFGETDEDALYGDEVGISPLFTAPLVDGDAVLDIALRVIDDSGFTSDSQAIVNVNNIAPVVEAQTFFIDEGVSNGAFVGQVVARDFDSDVLTFAITGGNGQSVFSIDPDTGEISVADTSQLNRSTTSSFTLEVEVADDDGSSASATMTVLVEDVGSLEVQQFQIDDGAPQQSNIDILSIRFNEATNVNGLIQSGHIYNAVQLIDPSGSPVNLDDGQARFAYDESTFTLTVDLTTEVTGIGGSTILSADGEYELRLDTSLIHESDGSHQLLDTDGSDDGILRFTFQRVLGDFDGNGTVNVADRFLFLDHYNTSAGDADYNAEFDLDGDGDIDRIDYVILRSRLPRGSS